MVPFVDLFPVPIRFPLARLPSGKPDVRLFGRMLARSERRGVTAISVSISHSRENAVAVAIAERPSSEAPSGG